MENADDLKKETISKYETEHGICEAACLVYYDSDYDLYSLNENVSEDDINECYESIISNKAEEYYEGRTNGGDSDIFSGINIDKVKNIDIDDIFNTSSNRGRIKTSVSESDTVQAQNIPVRLSRLKIRIKNSSSIDEASYSIGNIKSAAADLYNIIGERKLLLCYSHNGREEETEIIHVDAEDNTTYIEQSGDIAEIEKKILEIQMNVLSELMKLQKADYKALVTDDGYEDKVKKAREKRASGKKYIREKRGTLENVFSNISFSGYDLSATDFSGNTFIECEFDGTDFTACNFIDAVFVGCSLEKAVLKDAVLENTKFYILKQ